MLLIKGSEKRFRYSAVSGLNISSGIASNNPLFKTVPQISNTRSTSGASTSSTSQPLLDKIDPAFSISLLVAFGKLKLVISFTKAALGFSGTAPVNGASIDFGSSMCLPAITDKPNLRSLTDRAIGPSVTKASETPKSINGSIELT